MTGDGSDDGSFSESKLRSFVSLLSLWNVGPECRFYKLFHTQMEQPAQLPRACAANGLTSGLLSFSLSHRSGARTLLAWVLSQESSRCPSHQYLRFLSSTRAPWKILGCSLVVYR